MQRYLNDLLLQREAEESEMPVQTAEETGVDSSDQYEFLLVDHNDYVAVYQLPEREIYEYTDVIMEVLPEDVQKEVQHGKYIKNEEELYNFLENYTS